MRLRLPRPFPSDRQSLAGALRLLRLPVALIFVIPSVLAQPGSGSAYDRGKQALTQRLYEQAADLFAEAAKLPAAPADTLLLEARALLENERLPEADHTVRAYLATDVRSASGLYLLGDVLFLENRPRESLETYTRAAAIRTPSAEDLRVVALDYVLLDSYPDARHWLTRALSLNPQNPLALYDLGRVDMHDGNFNAALQHFEASLALDPGAPRTLNNLGLTFEALNRPADALASYARAIQSQRTGPHTSEQPLLNQGALLTTQNRAGEAVLPLTASVRIAPRCIRCHEELARALAAVGQLSPAIEQLRAAIALEPQNPRLHFQLGQLCRRAGLLEEARREFERSSTLYGTKSSTPNP